MPELDEQNLHLARAVALAALAREHGNDPFGALIVTSSGIVVEAENSVVTDGDPTCHAETNLVRKASSVLSGVELAGATLYTSTEPCAMCAGAIFWSGIPKVVYAFAESSLNALLPDDAVALALAIECREIFARGGHPVEVVGPIDIPGAREVHERYWG